LDLLFLSLVTAISCRSFLFFFFNDPPTTEIYTLSLHDALPISHVDHRQAAVDGGTRLGVVLAAHVANDHEIGRGIEVGGVEAARSEEHTSELQSLAYLVCRLLLEKKKRATVHRRRHEQVDLSVT